MWRRLLVIVELVVLALVVYFYLRPVYLNYVDLRDYEGEQWLDETARPSERLRMKMEGRSPRELRVFDEDRITIAISVVNLSMPTTCSLLLVAPGLRVQVVGSEQFMFDESYAPDIPSFRFVSYIISSDKPGLRVVDLVYKCDNGMSIQSSNHYMEVYEETTWSDILQNLGVPAFVGLLAGEFFVWLRTRKRRR